MTFDIKILFFKARDFEQGGDKERSTIRSSDREFEQAAQCMATKLRKF